MAAQKAAILLSSRERISLTRLPKILLKRFCKIMKSRIVTSCAEKETGCLSRESHCMQSAQNGLDISAGDKPTQI